MDDADSKLARGAQPVCHRIWRSGTATALNRNAGCITIDRRGARAAAQSRPPARFISCLSHGKSQQQKPNQKPLTQISLQNQVGWNAGASPARRVGLFTTEPDPNSVAARRGWKLGKGNRQAITTVNHIE